jgi:signal transduction histidine kinase
VDVELVGEGETVHLRVRDGGIGLTAQERVSLFRRYSRAARATEYGVSGLGLGLYLCSGIVQAHGGRIWAESDGPGLGSTFHIALPRVMPRERREAQEIADSAGPAVAPPPPPADAE